MIICPLCECKVEKLHKRSHIIPEWMYKDVYDKNNKMINVDINRMSKSKKQKGYYDEIICTACEEKSQKYDHYASLILTERSKQSPEYLAIDRKINKQPVRKELHSYSHWKNIEFHKLQKFVFICLLRTHLSMKKKGEYLLVDRHYKKIREIYMSSTISDDKSYPIIIVKYLDEDGFKDIIHLPYIDKKDGHFLIDFGGGGYLFNIYVSNHPKPDDITNLCLIENGSVYLVHDYIEQLGVLKGVSSKVIEIGKKYSGNNK